MENNDMLAPPVVNVSGLPLTKTQLRRYHHYYVSPVLGQLQDPMVVEALGKKSRERVKQLCHVSDGLWARVIAQQVPASSGRAAPKERVKGSGWDSPRNNNNNNNRGGALISRPPCPTDLYLLSAGSHVNSGVTGYLARDSAEIEGVLGFLQGLVALHVTPGPVPPSLHLDLDNPLIYEDTVSILQSVAWHCDWMLGLGNPAVWSKVSEITGMMTLVGFDAAKDHIIDDGTYSFCYTTVLTFFSCL
jgi:hypothetical protein